MNYAYWPKVYVCPHCGTKSNTSVCPKKECLEVMASIEKEKKS